jgi:hypothetical protein
MELPSASIEIAVSSTKSDESKRKLLFVEIKPNGRALCEGQTAYKDGSGWSDPKRSEKKRAAFRVVERGTA